MDHPIQFCQREEERRSNPCAQAASCARFASHADGLPRRSFLSPRNDMNTFY